jgi:hypothetical protein
VVGTARYRVTRTVPNRTATSKGIVNPPQIDLSRTLATGGGVINGGRNVVNFSSSPHQSQTVLLVFVKKLTLRAAFHRGAPQIVVIGARVLVDRGDSLHESRPAREDFCHRCLKTPNQDVLIESAVFEINLPNCHKLSKQSRQLERGHPVSGTLGKDDKLLKADQFCFRAWDGSRFGP